MTRRQAIAGGGSAAVAGAMPLIPLNSVQLSDHLRSLRLRYADAEIAWLQGCQLVDIEPSEPLEAQIDEWHEWAVGCVEQMIRFPAANAMDVLVKLEVADNLEGWREEVQRRDGSDGERLIASAIEDLVRLLDVTPVPIPIEDWKAALGG